MTKNERIELLKHRVALLEAHLSALSDRIKVLESKPQVVNVHNAPPGTPWPPIPWRNDVIDPYCTCGTSAICPLHGPATHSETPIAAFNVGFGS